MPMLKVLPANWNKENVEDDLEKICAHSRARLTGTTPGGTTTATLMCQAHVEIVGETAMSVNRALSVNLRSSGCLAP